LVHGHTLDRQTLDRQTLDRQTLDRQTLDKTNPGHDKPRTRQTLDTIEDMLRIKAVYTVTKHFHILPDFLTLLHPDFSSFFTGYRNLILYMERTVIKSRVGALVIVLGSG
jgi:hypothetical protein